MADRTGLSFRYLVSGRAALIRRLLPQHAETKQASWGAILLMASSLGVGTGNLAFNVVIARGGGVKLYGLISALLFFATIAGVLSVATNYAIAREVARSDGISWPLVRRCMAAFWPWLSVSAFLLVLSAPVADFLHLRSRLPAQLAVGLFALIIICAGPTGMLVGLGRFGVLALLGVGAVVGRLTVGVIAVHGSHPLVGALMATMVSPLLSGTLALVAILGWGRRRLAWRGDMAPAAYASNLSGDVVAGAVLFGLLWTLWSLPVVFSRHWLDQAAAGNFAAAQLLASGVFYVSQPVVTAFFPAVARGSRLSTAVTGLVGILVIDLIGIAGLVTVGPVFMPLVYGRQFGVPPLLFASLALSVAVVSTTNYLIWMTRATHRFVTSAYVAVLVATLVELALASIWHPTAEVIGAEPAIALATGCAAALGAAVGSGFGSIGRFSFLRSSTVRDGPSASLTEDP